MSKEVYAVHLFHYEWMIALELLILRLKKDTEGHLIKHSKTEYSCEDFKIDFRRWE